MCSFGSNPKVAPFFHAVTPGNSQQILPLLAVRFGITVITAKRQGSCLGSSLVVAIILTLPHPHTRLLNALIAKK